MCMGDEGIERMQSLYTVVDHVRLGELNRLLELKNLGFRSIEENLEIATERGWVCGFSDH